MPQYQRKIKHGIRWWYKFSYGGLTYHSKAIYLSKNEAKRAENEKYKKVEQQAQNPSQKPDLSLLQVINERLDYIEVKRTKNYYKANKAYYTRLLDHIGDIPISQIKKKDINDFLIEMSKEAKRAGNDNYAVNYMHNLYLALFNHAIEQHELEMRNPCSGIQFFAVKKKIKYIPSDKDIVDVRKLCDPEQLRLFDFVAETAARISEPLKITGKDILEEHVILYTKKSRNSNIVPRKVPKPDCIKDISIGENERLFGRWEDAPNFLERKIKTLKQRRWNWHNLRHRRASLWNKEGKSLFEIMSLLGHSNLSTTQKYLQLLS